MPSEDRAVPSEDRAVAPECCRGSASTLAEVLGLSAAEIGRLHDRGVVKGPIQPAPQPATV